MFKKNKAQSLSEYAIILALVAAALIAMQVYMKRGMQGRMRDLANQISPAQYESNTTQSTTTTVRDATVSEEQLHATYLRTTNETTTRDSFENVTGD